MTSLLMYFLSMYWILEKKSKRQYLIKRKYMFNYFLLYFKLNFEIGKYLNQKKRLIFELIYISYSYWIYFAKIFFLKFFFISIISEWFITYKLYWWDVSSVDEIGHINILRWMHSVWKWQIGFQRTKNCLYHFIQSRQQSIFTIIPFIKNLNCAPRIRKMTILNN